MLQSNGEDKEVTAEAINHRSERAGDFAQLFAMLDRPAEIVAMRAGYAQLVSGLGVARRRCVGRR